MSQTEKRSQRTDLGRISVLSTDAPHFLPMLRGYGVLISNSGTLGGLLERTASFLPDVIIIDLVWATKAVVSALLDTSPTARIVLVAQAGADYSKVLRAVESGATAVVSRPYAPMDMFLVVTAEIEHALTSEWDRIGTGERTNLTPRERQMLALIFRGHNDKDAARELNISPRAASVHGARAISKLGDSPVRSRRSA